MKTFDSGEMTQMEGVYETEATGTRLQKNYNNNGTVHLKIFKDNGKLYVQRPGINRTELIHVDDSTWHLAPDPFNRFIFQRNASGKIVGLTTTGMFTQSGPNRFAKKISSTVPAPPPIVLIDSEQLKVYTGLFQQPDGTRQKLVIEKSRLVLTDEDNVDKKDLSYIGNDTFFDPKTEIKYKFTADKSGRAVKINYFDGAADIDGTRIRDNY